MRRLLCALGVCLGAVVHAAGQATPAGPLPREFRTHLQDERFDVVTSLRGLPLGVRNELSALFGSGALDIAEPGEEFRRSATGDAGLPTRRLIAAGCSTTFYCLVFYERGGAVQTRNVALFRWTPATTQLAWGGVVPPGLSTIEDVRKAVLSGAIKDQPKSW